MMNDLFARWRNVINEVKSLNPSTTIVCATKTVPADIINQLPKVGLAIAGENRVQEFLLKRESVQGIDWHFIGRLQTNKVKYLIDNISLLHSLDSTRLASEIERQCQRRGTTLNALIEVNIGGEEAKGGIAPDQIEDFAKYIKCECPHVCIKGLMTVMPATKSDEESKHLYLHMRKLYDMLLGRGFDCEHLSMGMSGDYATAIKYGANMVRLGTILFGERY